MINKFIYNDLIKEAQRIQDIRVQSYSFGDVLNETDFYPPPDNRVWETYIEDIEDGDNFVDYCKYFFSICDEEEYFD